MKAPYGNCRYCGNEFMSKQSLERHEETKCLLRPIAETEAKPLKPRFTAIAQGVGGAMTWVRNNE